MEWNHYYTAELLKWPPTDTSQNLLSVYNVTRNILSTVFTSIHLVLTQKFEK